MTDLIRQQKNEEIERLKKELEELNDHPPPEEIKEQMKEILKDDSDDEIIEIQKKPARPRTAKQQEQFKKVVEAKMKNASERKAKAELKAIEDKQELEDKLVNKAIAVKKKQIQKQKIIDDISEEEEDDKVIQKMKPVKKPIKAIVISKYKFI